MVEIPHLGQAMELASGKNRAFQVRAAEDVPGSWREGQSADVPKPERSLATGSDRAKAIRDPLAQKNAAASGFILPPFSRMPREVGDVSKPIGPLQGLWFSAVQIGGPNTAKCRPSLKIFDRLNPQLTWFIDMGLHSAGRLRDHSDTKENSMASIIKRSSNTRL
jgi:hypothetical protein